MQRNAYFFNKTYLEVVANLAGTYCGAGSHFRGAGDGLCARDIREALNPDLSNLAVIVQALEQGVHPRTILPTVPTAPFFSAVERERQSHFSTTVVAPETPPAKVNGRFANQVGERVTTDANFLPFLNELHQTALRLAKTSSAQEECRRLFDGILKNSFFNKQVALMLSLPDAYPMPKKEGARWADCYQKIMNYANYIERLAQLSEHEKSVSKMPVAERCLRFYSPYQEAASSVQTAEQVVPGVKMK